MLERVYLIKNNNYISFDVKNISRLSERWYLDVFTFRSKLNESIIVFLYPENKLTPTCSGTAHLWVLGTTFEKKNTIELKFSTEFGFVYNSIYLGDTPDPVNNSCS